MAKLPVYNLRRESVGEINLSDDVFGRDVNEDLLYEIVKAQLVSLHLGRLKDAGTFTPQQVSLAKRNNVNIATEIAREARRLLGANGILAEYGAMRHMANLESVYTYEGTHDVHSLILGQAVTGLNAFK